MWLKKLLCLLLATTLPAEQNGLSAQEETDAAARRSIPAPENQHRVKLCGREFVRAVVFTCGGSRWKRAYRQPQDRDGDGAGAARAEFVQTSSKNGPNIKSPSVLDLKLKQLQSNIQPARQQPLKEVFKLEDDYNDYVPTSYQFREYFHPGKKYKSRTETGIETSSDSYNVPRVKYFQRKEDLSIAATCCKWGCTQMELNALC